MNWSNVKLIFHRELRDQLRDRRTIFTVLVLPLLLYPLLGMTFLQVSQFMREHPCYVWIVSADELPQQPPLIIEDTSTGDYQFVTELCQSEHEAELLKLEMKPLGDDADFTTAARKGLTSGKCDVVLVLPKGFSTQATAGPDDDTLLNSESARPRLFFTAASDKSRIANQRVLRILEKWRSQIVSRNLAAQHIPVSATRPFVFVNTDLAEASEQRMAVWSKILPFVLVIWAMTGAFYPAVDLCAGEKERGTLETLLSSPAGRREIVWGKLGTTTLFSMVTSLLNVASMGITGSIISQQMAAGDGPNIFPDMGAPPLVSIAWLLPAIVPLAALFSALSIAVATMARSTKEGHYYLLPLLMAVMPLVMLPLLPGTQFELGTSLIPVTGVMLLLRSLMEGQYAEAARYCVPVIGVSIVCCLLAIRWAVDQFNNESVLFSDSERLDLGLWLRSLVRDRSPTPSFAEACLCGILLLVIRFFGSLTMTITPDWHGFWTSTVVTLVAFIAAPALIMTIVLTSSVRKTLLLRMPRLTALPGAILLAMAMHPLVMLLTMLVSTIYPISPEAIEGLKPFTEAIKSAPSIWHLLAVIALAPAICEELAFRGFILSGLRHMGRKWGAIVISAAFFGIAHGLLQQSIMAFGVGIVIGYLAVQTGSILPGILFHLTHNSLGILVGLLTSEQVANNGLARVLFVSSRDSYLSSLSEPGDGEAFVYRLPVLIGGAVIAALLLAWYRKLPSTASQEERLQEALTHQAG